jgi:3-oxoacyl-[acyl-carrier-protein] synthase-3
MKLLSVGTTSPDQIQPSHASMVHGELNINLLKSIQQQVFATGMNALNYGFLSVKAGVQENAVCAGSERMSAWMTQINSTMKQKI